MSTLHILSSPTKPVHINNRTDPFSIAVIKFIKNMTALGWNCVHYGIAGAQVDCELVLCLDQIYPDASTCVEEYNKKAAIEIAKRKQPKDLIMCFYGCENKFAAEANKDLPIVEPSIGYDTKAVFAPFRVFTSYAHMHMFYGERGMLMNPSWFDTVIPNAFSEKEFEYNENKKDYFLYFGRVIEAKGVHLAIQATKEVGQKLIIAGAGSLKSLGYQKTPDHVLEFGIADVNQRKQLMSGAKAILGPTYYVEPFGNMVIEGYFCGTPSITTDWGGFTETVIPGVTGYRCREFKEFIHALKNIDKIQPKLCLDYARSKYSEEIVHRQFDHYLNKIRTRDFYRK